MNTIQNDVHLIGIIIGHSFIRKYQRQDTHFDDAQETLLVKKKDNEYLKKFHAGFMILALVMVTGAGIMFSRRFVTTMDCRNVFSPI